MTTVAADQAARCPDPADGRRLHISFTNQSPGPGFNCKDHDLI